MKLFSVFKNVNDFKPEDGDYYKISETKSFYKKSIFCFINRSTALIDSKHLDDLKSNSLHPFISSSGPEPFPNAKTEFEPEFWVNFQNSDGEFIKLKPLTVSWEKANNTVSIPDQGFLMTYGLTPRILEKNGLVVWDDLRNPTYNVVESKLVSKLDYPDSSHSYIRILKDYIHDFSSLTNKCIVQVLYFEIKIPNDKELDNLLEKKMSIADVAPKYYQRFVKIDSNDYQYHGELNTFFTLSKPGNHPVSEEISLDDLEWNSRKLSDMFEYVYVKDTALAKYEGKTEYEITPEIGSVSYKELSTTIWGIGYCQRIGRDLIQIELRKLYESVPANEIIHWHKHSVEVPENLDKLRNQDNIADRSKRIVYNLVELAELLNSLADMVNLKLKDEEKFISYERSNLDYYGWWKGVNIEKITRHISHEFNIEDLVSRTKDLANVLIESLNEKQFRKLLIELGISKEEITKYKSIKLLDYLLELIKGSNNTGLPIKDYTKRETINLNDPSRISSVYPLYKINQIRQIDAHKQSQSWEKELQKNLNDLEIDYKGSGTKIYSVADNLYDKIYQMLDNLNSSLKLYIREQTAT